MLELFSNRCSPFETVRGGFFLRKKPLGRSGFGVQQLENRYSCGDRSIEPAKWRGCSQRERIKE
jgi:hypothetical protein